MVAVEQGRTAEAVPDVVNEAIHSMTKIAGNILAGWIPRQNWRRNSILTIVTL